MNIGKRFSNLIAAALVAALLAIVLAAAPARAATPNFAPGVSVVVLTFQYDGQFTATTAGVTRFDLPFAARAVSVQASCATVGGTTPELAVDVADDGTSILSATADVSAADTVVFGTIDAPALADESEITVDFTITGTSPAFDDCTVLVTLART